MKKAKVPIYPILFGIFPVVTLYSHNLSLVQPRSMFVMVGEVVVAIVLVWALLSLILRSVERSAPVVTVFTVMFFIYGHAWRVLNASTLTVGIFESEITYYCVWMVVTLLLAFLVGKRWKFAANASRFLAVVGFALFAMAVVSAASGWLGVQQDIRKRQAAAKSSTGGQMLSLSEMPDIYYIILDGFGRRDSLSKYIGYDDSSFVKALEGRGFYVAANSHSNYCQTELSLTSSLNMDYLEKVVPDFSPTSNNRYTLDALIDVSAVSRLLRSKGYEYLAVMTGAPMINPNSADRVLQAAEVGSAFFQSMVLGDTPIHFLTQSEERLGGQTADKRTNIVQGFKNLEALAGGTARPRFIFTHIFAPHPPFVFNRDGSAREQSTAFSIADGSHYMYEGHSLEDYKQGFAGQAEYTAKLTFEAVDTIIKHSTRPPIIIVQGDHGSKAYLDQESAEKTEMKEVFSNLNAYYVPPAIKAKLYPSITPVNSFRLIFSTLFGANLPPLPDSSFYSSWSKPFLFTDVSSKTLQNLQPAPGSNIPAKT